jgi:hypothetical protein
VLVEEQIVVGDDPVVHADHGSVTDGVVVGGEAGMALRESRTWTSSCVASSGTWIRSSSAGGPGALLVQRHGRARAAEGVPDGVGAALGDSGQQRAGSDSRSILLSSPRLYPAIPHKVSESRRATSPVAQSF